MFRLFALTVALCAFLAPAWAAGAADPATFRLTPALLDRMEAAAAELKPLPPAHRKGNPNAADDDDGGDNAKSVEDIARQLEADPRVRAALARHGLTAREYATATLAALHAGMALAMEKAPGGAQAAQGFTPAQRANVEVMRARTQKPRK